MRPIDVLQSLWPLLAVLVYLMVTCMLSILASAYQYEVMRHDLVRRARTRRLEYLRSLAEPPENQKESAQEVVAPARARAA